VLEPFVAQVQIEGIDMTLRPQHVRQPPHSHATTRNLRVASILSISAAGLASLKRKP
jgi:hypothetical protein